MKKCFVFISLILLLGCKKENDTPSPTPSGATSASIVNKWELQINISDMYTNGILTSGDTTYEAPNELWMKFNNDNTFIEYQNTVATDSGTYTFSNSLLTFMNASDTSLFNSTLTSTTLNLNHIEIDLSSLPDTIKFETKLTFIKI